VKAAGENGLDDATARAVVRVAAGTLCPAASAAGLGPSAPPTPVVLAPAKKITAREWQLIAKDPGSHIGERVTVYGQVTQFDATIGTARRCEPVPRRLPRRWVRFERCSAALSRSGGATCSRSTTRWSPSPRRCCAS
jgi:hypothetical protein